MRLLTTIFCCLGFVYAQTIFSKHPTNILGALPDGCGLWVWANDYKAIRKSYYRRWVDAILNVDTEAYIKRTRQVSKISAKVSAMEEAAGFRFIPENLDPLIGSPSAVAFYGIGDIEFVYATSVPSIPQSLQKLRGWYNEGEYKGIKYFTVQKSRQGAWLGYFFHKGTLVISNSNEQFNRALRVFAGEESSVLADSMLNKRLIPYISGQDAIACLYPQRLQDNSYYHRYWQGELPQNQNFSNVFFFVDIDGKRAKITRVSFPTNKISVKQAKIPSSIELASDDELLYRETAVQNAHQIYENSPVVAQIIGDDTLELPFSNVAEFWTIQNDMIIPVTVLLFTSVKPDDWISRKRDRFIAGENFVPGYLPRWKEKDGVNYLVDPLGIELGIAYKTIDNKLLISPSREKLAKLKPVARNRKIEQNCIYYQKISSSNSSRTILKNFRLLLSSPGVMSPYTRAVLEQTILPATQNLIELFNKVEIFEYYDEEILKTETIIE